MKYLSTEIHTNEQIAYGVRLAFIRRFGKPSSLPDEELIQLMWPVLKLEDQIPAKWKTHIILGLMMDREVKIQEELERSRRKMEAELRRLKLSEPKPKPPAHGDDDIWSNADINDMFPIGED
jgi:hypothetical protein